MDDLTPEEIAWISNSKILSDECYTYERKSEDRRAKKQKTNVHIGEITMEGQSLIKGSSKGINTGDEVVFTISKSISNVDIARFKHIKSGREIGKLSNSDASFIGSMIESGLACFSGSIIFIPSVLKLLGAIYLSVKVELVPSAFFEQDGIDAKKLEDSSLINAHRKRLLGTLFERTGLIDEKQAAMCKISTSTRNILDDIHSSDMAKIFGKSNTDKIHPIDPAEGMKLNLRDYQKVALAFMLSKERLQIESSSISPLWIEMKPRNKPFYLNICSGELSFNFPKENYTAGGILADEMGLGKTIEILALIHTNRFMRPIVQSQGLQMTHSTLIVCPLNLISQWHSEAKRSFTTGLVTSDIFYGNERQASFESSNAPTIVISTYGTLKSEYSKPNSPLFAIHWHRVVLDEAHFIKERTTETAKSVFALNASFRWCVTGTPIVNKLDDLYSLVKFLRVEPWCTYHIWRSFITQPFARRDAKAIEVVQAILEPLLLRRTKDMRDSSGNLVIPLPKKEIETLFLQFSPQEMELYKKVSEYSIKKVEQLRLMGKADYIHVFSLLIRLRQICCHPSLVQKKSSADGGILEMGLTDILRTHLPASAFASKVAIDLQEEVKECPVCFETRGENTLLPCYHIICKNCVEDMFESSEKKDLDFIECPVCRKQAFEKDLIKILIDQRREDNENTKHDSQRKLAFQDLGSSAKVKALLREIESVFAISPTDKIIVFSQWTSMLDIIQAALESQNYNYARLDGSIPHKKREAILESLKSDPNVKILLASLRSTGTGLNLVVANHVFLVDPWWNAAVENQAIDRVHRLGQGKPVFVKKLIIKDTIEEKMLLIQSRKSNLINSFNGDAEKLDLETMIQFLY